MGSGKLLEAENGTVIHNKQDVTTLVTDHKSKQQPPEENTSPQFFKLAKKFAIDGALLPDNNKILIEDRAIKRDRLTQLRKQKNIETIMHKTLEYCENFEIGHSTDLDWFNRYITLAEEVSNSTMQDLWAKILAGELTKPGSFSYKALKVFRDMSINDAKLLAKASSLAIKDPNHKSIRLFTGVYQKPGLLNFFSKTRQQYCNLSQFGLNYADLLALSENQLLYIQESESNLINKGEVLEFSYNGLPLKLRAAKSDVCLQFYKFTPLGVELANLISDKGNDNFFEYLQGKLKSFFLIYL